MNRITRCISMKWSFTLMVGMLCLGLATSTRAQNDPAVRSLTCAQIKEAGAGQKMAVGPENLATVTTSDGGTFQYLPVMIASVVSGDTVTITLSPGVSETSDPTLAPVATVAQWHLAIIDPASVTSPNPPPPTTVASGGTLGSTLTYTATTTGLLLIAADQLDGYATLAAGCTHVAPSAVPGVKVDLGSLAPQTGIFPTDSDTLTFTFDIAADDKVKALLPGQSVTLPVTAVVDPALLADSCGCIANTLTGEVTYALPAKTEPTPVPTLSEITLTVLGLLVAAAAVRSGPGRHGLKALAVLGLGAALLYPGHDLRAAGGNALETLQVSLTGTMVTVTVKRNPDCKVNTAPVLPVPSIELTGSPDGYLQWSIDGDTASAFLPAASDPEGDSLTYSFSDLPTDWAFDPSTRKLTLPITVSCAVDSDGNPVGNSVAGKVFYYGVADQCHPDAVRIPVTCTPYRDGVPVGGL